MSKFKVGDKVKITGCSTPMNCIGAITTLTDYDGTYWHMDKTHIHKEKEFELVEPKPKFKVGDRVRILWEETDYGNCYDTNYGVVISFDSSGYVRVEMEGSKTNLGFKPEWLLLEGECNSCESNLKCGLVGALEEFKIYTYNEPTTSSIKKSGNIMSKLTSFVKNSLLSADEKLLRKYGLKDDCGEYTSEAEVLVQQKLIKDNEAYLIEVATAMEAEEKKNK